MMAPVPYQPRGGYSPSGYSHVNNQQQVQQYQYPAMQFPAHFSAHYQPPYGYQYSNQYQYVEAPPPPCGTNTSACSGGHWPSTPATNTPRRKGRASRVQEPIVPHENGKFHGIKIWLDRSFTSLSSFPVSLHLLTCVPSALPFF